MYGEIRLGGIEIPYTLFDLRDGFTVIAIARFLFVGIMDIGKHTNSDVIFFINPPSTG